MKVGFIGIGQMGVHMAGNIQAAGNELVVNDANKEAAAPLLATGAVWADTPKDVAEACRLVISCLPTPQIVEEVALGPDGLQAAWKAGDIYIDMSTNSPSTVRRIAAAAAERGVRVLDAPVSGGTRGAEAGHAHHHGGRRRGRARGGPARSWSPWRTRSSIWATWAAATWPSWSTT